MASCEKCWREYKETIMTDIGVYHYCGLHAKQLKDSLDPNLYY
jgi:hypothetical protein